MTISRANKEGINNLYSRNDYVSSIDGELVLTATTSFSSTYKARFDSGSNNIYTFSTSTGWTMMSKDGTLYQFGTTTKSRMDDNGNANKVFSWYLDRVTDQNGNYMSYWYTKDSNQVYPSWIKYTGSASTTPAFQVDFTKSTATRTDAIPSFKTGFLVISKFTITQIKTSAMGSWARKYDLVYTPGVNGSRSMLAQVIESGRNEAGDVTVLPATNLSYNANTIGWSEVASPSLPIPFKTGEYSTNQSVRVSDVNGDALPDILQTIIDGSGNCAVLISHQTPNQSFASPVTQVASSSCASGMFPNLFAFDKGARLADINGDGRDDILSSLYEHGTGQTFSKVYENTPTGFAATSTFGYATPHFFNSYSGPQWWEILDRNGDALADVHSPIMATSYLTTITASSSTAGGSPLPFTQVLTQDKAHSADINGDGLVDEAIGEQIALNTGSTFVMGSTTVSTLKTPSNLNSTYPDNGLRFGDINGDRLPDLVSIIHHQDVFQSYPYYAYSSVGTAYINTGTSFVSTPLTVPADSQFVRDYGDPNYRDGGWRMFDVNSDGAADLVGSPPGVNRVVLNTAVHNDLLKTVTLPQGAELGFGYKSSTQYKDTNGNLLNPKLPYPVTLLASTTRTVGGVLQDVRTFSYASGTQYFQSYNNKQFAGFETITETDAGLGTTKTFYHQGNGTLSALGEVADSQAKIGRPFRTERYSSTGTLLSTEINAWEETALEPGRSIVLNTRTTTITSEGTPSTKASATTRTFDTATGNLLSTTDYGEVSANQDGTFTDLGTDARTTLLTYATHATSAVTSKISSKTLKDFAGATSTHERFAYDNLPEGQVGKGNLTQEWQLIASSTYASSTYTYNSSGMVTLKRYPSFAKVSYSYDAYHLYSNWESDNHHRVSYAAWNYALGKPKETRDKNIFGQTFEYDGLGRLTKESAQDPNTNATSTVKTIVYDDIRNNVSSYTRLYRSDTEGSDTYRYYDGLGRLTQERSRHEGGLFSTTDTTYTRDNLVLTQSLPYYSTGSAKTPVINSGALVQRFAYDHFNRPTSVVNILGTTTSTYAPLKKTVLDPQGNKKDLYNDFFGNLTQVVEYPSTSTPATTTYEYTTHNKLKKITDALGNIRNFAYDARGLRVYAEDMHAPGDTTFAVSTSTYDLNGNLTQEMRPGSTENFTYNSLDILYRRDLTQTSGYDDQYTLINTIGLLDRIASSTTRTGTTHDYTYYRNGKVATDRMIVGTSSPALTTYEYDRQGNLTLLTLPDNSQIRYTYNDLGKVETIERKEASDAAFLPVVTNVNYGPHGRPVYIRMSNNTDTYYTYDPRSMYRLVNLSTIDPEDGASTPPATVEPLSTSTIEMLSATSSDTVSTSTMEALLEAITENLVPEGATTTATSSEDVLAPITATTTATSTDQTVYAFGYGPEATTTATTTASSTDATTTVPVITTETSDVSTVVVDTQTFEEDVSLRTANSETFVLKTEAETETRMTRFYPSAIHVRDEAGEWIKPETDFVPTDEGLELDLPDYSLSIPNDENELFTMSVGTLAVTLEPDLAALTSSPSEPATTSEQVSLEAGSTTADIADVFGNGVDAEIKTSMHHVTKDIIIESADALTRFPLVDGYYEIPFTLSMTSGAHLFSHDLAVAAATTTDRFEIRLGTQSLYVMPGQVHDSGHARSAISFSIVSTSDGYALAKRIPASFFADAQYPVITDATLSSSPHITDGVVGVNQTVGTSTAHRFALARATTTGSYVALNDAYGVTNYDYYPNAQGYRFERAFFAFDTSSIPDTATVASSTFRVASWVDAGGSVPSIALSPSTRASSTNLSAADFGQVVDTQISNAITVGNYTDYHNAGAKVFTFTPAGSTTINRTGWTQFAVRSLADIHNTPTNAPQFITYFTFAEGHSSVPPIPVPSLAVTYVVPSLPARATQLRVNGQPNASGVATPRPTLTAVYNDTDVTDQAKAYQIQVIAQAATWTSPIWDSGYQPFPSLVSQGSTTPDILFGSTTLTLPTDGAKYFWRMKLWDVGDQEGTWSDGSDFFTMAMTPTVQFDTHVDCLSAQSGRKSPYGLKCGAPVFSAKNNATSTAYSAQIVVATSSDFAATSTIPLWNSGIFAIDAAVPGARTGDLVYRGPGLRFASTTYYYRIQLFNQSGASLGWSIPDQFSTYASRVFQNQSYTYDMLGNILSLNDFSDMPTSKHATYTYDGLSRLLSASAVATTGTSLYAHTYSYNAIGNLLTAEGRSYAYAATGNITVNAPTTVGTSTLTYDTRSNVIGDGIRSFAYWPDNLLATSTLLSGGAASTTAYLYDVSKQRVQTRNGTSTTQYLNRFYNVAFDHTGATSTKKITKHIMLGDQNIATIESTVAIAGTSTATTTNAFYTHTDPLGSSAVITGEPKMGTTTYDVIVPATYSTATTTVTLYIAPKQSHAVSTYTDFSNMGYTYPETGQSWVATTSYALKKIGIWGTRGGGFASSTATFRLYQGYGSGKTLLATTSLSTGDFIPFNDVYQAERVITLPTTISLASGTPYSWTVQVHGGSSFNELHLGFGNATALTDWNVISGTSLFPNSRRGFKTYGESTDPTGAVSSSTVVSTSTTMIAATSTVATTSVGLIPSEIQAIDYLPFGQMRVNYRSNDAGSFDEQRKFTGYEYDLSSDLSYANARYYNQNLGLFLSQDPAVLEMGRNSSYTSRLQIDPQINTSHGYSRNNPLVMKDPDGQMPTAVVGAAVGAAIGVGSQVAADYLSGNEFDIANYTGAAAGGAVQGALWGSGAGVASAIFSGAAGGTAQGLTRESMQKIRGDTGGFQSQEIINDLLIGGGAGFFGQLAEKAFGQIAITGITSGRNSFASITKGLETKLSKGLIANLSVSSQMKSALSYGVKDGYSTVAQIMYQTAQQNNANTSKQPGWTVGRYWQTPNGTVVDWNGNIPSHHISTPF